MPTEPTKTGTDRTVIGLGATLTPILSASNTCVGRADFLQTDILVEFYDLPPRMADLT